MNNSNDSWLDKVLARLVDQIQADGDRVCLAGELSYPDQAKATILKHMKEAEIKREIDELYAKRPMNDKYMNALANTLEDFAKRIPLAGRYNRTDLVLDLAVAVHKVYESERDAAIAQHDTILLGEIKAELPAKETFVPNEGEGSQQFNDYANGYNHGVSDCEEVIKKHLSNKEEINHVERD